MFEGAIDKLLHPKTRHIRCQYTVYFTLNSKLLHLFERKTPFTRFIYNISIKMRYYFEWWLMLFKK